MPILTANAAIGASTIAVDSVADLPTALQFQVVIGSELAIVVGPAPVASPLQLGAPLTRSHRRGQRVGYVDPDAGVRGQLVGEVTMDDAGLRVFGTDATEQLDSASGFAGGSWDDRIEAGGIYNARFSQGSTTDMAASDGGIEATTTAAYEAAIEASDLPGWAINASPGALKVITDTTIYGGTALESAGNANGDVNVIYQDVPLFSADPQQIELHVYRNGAGSVAMQTTATWRDADHGLLGSASVASVDLSAAGTATYIRQILKSSSQQQARYLRIKLTFTHTTTPRVIRVGALKRVIAWPTFAGYIAAHGLIFRHQPDGAGWDPAGTGASLGVTDDDAAMLLANAYLHAARAAATDRILSAGSGSPAGSPVQFDILRSGKIEWADGTGGGFDASIARTAASILSVLGSLDFAQQSGTQAANIADNYLLFRDITQGGGSEPTNPAAGRVKFYSRINAGGKTELRARFPSGAFVTVAVEP